MHVKFYLHTMSIKRSRERALTHICNLTHNKAGLSLSAVVQFPSKAWRLLTRAATDRSRRAALVLAQSDTNTKVQRGERGMLRLPTTTWLYHYILNLFPFKIALVYWKTANPYILVLKLNFI